MSQMHLSRSGGDRDRRLQPVYRESGPLAPQYLATARETPTFEEGGGLLDYWRILRRRKWTVLGFLLGSLIAALAYSLWQTPVYQARAQLEILGFNDNFMYARDYNPTALAPNEQPESIMQTQVKILESPSLIERVISKTQLDRQPPPQAGWFNVRRWLGFRQQEPPPRARLLEQVQGNLSVRVSGATRIVDILYDSSNPQFAAQFANTLAAEFIAQGQEMRWKAAQRTSEWLTDQLTDMKSKLEEAESRLQAYAAASGLHFTGERENQSVEDARLNQIQEELSRAQAERVSKQSKYELAATARAETLPEIIDDPTLRDFRSRLADLERQAADLRATLTPAHYRVQKIQAQIEEMRHAIEQTRGDLVRRIRNEYDSALRREKLLEGAYTTQARAATDQSAKAIRYNILKREVETNRQLYESLLQRVREAGVASAMRASNVLLVDPATPPPLPYKPNLTMNVAVGMLGGLFLAIGFLFFRERANSTIGSPGEAGLWLRLPELGVIPSVKAPLTDRLLARNRDKTLTLAPVDDPGGGPGSTWQPKPESLAESFRATLTSILFADNRGLRPRTIVVTSPGPAEGKTTAASNLAIAMGEIGRRVLLIDGDLRRPRLHKVFGVEAAPGLADMLSNQEPIDSLSLSAAVRETRAAGVWLLASGGETGNISRLLHSPRLSELIERARDDFDLVLIDAPPILNLADARILGRLTDGVILVVRAGQTGRETAQAAIQRFLEDGTTVLGAILNDWNPAKESAYGYSYGYSGHSG